jgi:ATP-binding cassette subfamily F protein 3
MLQATALGLHRGTKRLFGDADFRIHPGDRVGVTGANGTGKSSLFALILGELQADGGGLSMPPDWVISHVAQETPAVAQSALDFVLDGDGELRRVQAELAEAERRNDGERLGMLHARLETMDGYTAVHRAGRLLHGLGFRSVDYNRPVAEFSGGWRVRLNLARALMCRSDLLLLDEPTNHLDLDAVLWLEDWLAGYRGTLLLISHDRDFLDRVVTRILHLEEGRIRLYRGGYSDFERQRAEYLAQQQSAHDQQQREIAHMRAFVDRFRAKATKARQAQSRLKALERLERIAPAHVDSPFRFSFPPPATLPDPLLGLEQVAAGYGESPLLNGVSLTLRPGARLGLLGHNGAGKSTLIKLLAGLLPALAGRILAARGLQVGYFAQQQLEQLRAEDSPLSHLQRQAPQASEQALRDFLGGFGFQGDRVLEPVAPFSGGEKARLALALLIHRAPNLLLLDEPTNHLDLDMRLALTLALEEFNGAMVIVSHDRHLLRTVCDEFWLVDQGRVQPFVGDLENYRAWLASEDDSEPAGAQEAKEHSAAARRAQRREAAEQRQRLQPLRRELEQLEEVIERAESRLTDIEVGLSDPNLYQGERKEELTGLLEEQGRLRRQLAEAEANWFALSEQLESQ